MGTVLVTSSNRGRKMLAPILRETKFQESARTGKPNRSAMKRGKRQKGGGKR